MPQPSLQQLHEDFMADCRYSARLAPATLQNYQAAFELFIRIVPTASLDALTLETLTGFFRELETRRRMVGHGWIKQGVKSTTIATYRAKLNPFFKWLKVKKHIAASPFENTPYPKIVYDEPKYLHKEQIERIITAIDFAIPWGSLLIQKRNLALIMMLLYTGLRKGELLHIKLYDIDAERSELKVSAITSKSKQHKTVPLHSLVLRRVLDYLEERRKKGYTTPYLFASEERDAPLSESGLKHLIRKISKVSGVPFHVHQLRHTFAVNLISKGNDISVVQKLMGHKSIASTLTYLRCIPSKTLHRSVESLDWDSLV